MNFYFRNTTILQPAVWRVYVASVHAICTKYYGASGLSVLNIRGSTEIKKENVRYFTLENYFIAYAPFDQYPYRNAEKANDVTVLAGSTEM